MSQSTLSTASSFIPRSFSRDDFSLTSNQREHVEAQQTTEPVQKFSENSSRRSAQLILKRSIRSTMTDHSSPPCLSAEEAQRDRFNSYLRDGNEAQLELELNSLNDNEFQNFVNREFFEKLPPALFSSTEFRERLQHIVPEHNSWLSAAQRNIYENPGKCQFRGITRLSLGKPSVRFAQLIQNTTPASIRNSIEALLPALSFVQLSPAQKAALSQSGDLAEVERYIRECRPEFTPSVRTAV